MMRVVRDKSIGEPEKKEAVKQKETNKNRQGLGMRLWRCVGKT
jgi:hypothetical protein